MFSSKNRVQHKSFQLWTLLLSQEGRQAPRCSLSSDLTFLAFFAACRFSKNTRSSRSDLCWWISIWDAVKDMGMRMCETWEWGCVRHGNEDVWDMRMRMCETWEWGCVRHENEDVWDMGMKMCETWEWRCGRHGNEDVGDMGMRMWHMGMRLWENRTEDVGMKLWDKHLILTWNNRVCRRLVYRPYLPALTPGNRLQ